MVGKRKRKRKEGTEKGGGKMEWNGIDRKRAEGLREEGGEKGGKVQKKGGR